VALAVFSSCFLCQQRSCPQPLKIARLPEIPLALI
jgi:hypothetical protein